MKNLTSALLLVVLSPLLLIVGLVCLVCYPFWLFSYKRSPWYRERGEKYTWGIGSALYYKIYNLASKNGLPLKHEQMGGYHLFSFGDRLLFPLCDYTSEPEYDEQRGCFTVRESCADDAESADAFSLEEYLKTVEGELGDALGGRILTPIISESDAGDHIAKAQNVFLTYVDGKDLLRILEFCCSDDAGGRDEEAPASAEGSEDLNEE